MDSDDWVDADYFEKLYLQAKKKNADICCALNRIDVYENSEVITSTPLHKDFDCQIKLHKRILQIAKDETLFLKNLLDAHFCHAVLWRYKNYMADKHLSKSVKNNIKKLTAEFFSGDVNLEYKKAYFSYLIEKKDFNMFMRAYLFFPYYWLKLQSLKKQSYR